MSISTPQKIIFKKIAENNEQAIIGPCYPGFGITIGNALKRVMISSLEGGAVYAVKIKGVQHEFSTIPDVKEDVVEIILNLKQLHLKIHTDKEVKLTLEARGKKEIKVKDIKATSDVELINKDMHLATLTSAKAQIKMDIFVKKGRGYWTIEDRVDDENKEIGTILIDSFFSPIEKVGLNIENTRVERMTNYENIILDIKTDGTISPKKALKKSVEILIKQFNSVFDNINIENKKKGDKKTIKKDDKKEVTKKTVKKKIHQLTEKKIKK
ncbi:MAG: DNA-directed RNA polymerase subunit alpha [Xanthomonadaceae bacterium]|nr:DNA-directed RNA polymerase subunit alpha [Rhodospirillaceae bacterium]NIA17927.1 DNA-directed RNA polymerase subunit alpha [Xanthomonadaceae bacterium]